MLPILSYLRSDVRIPDFFSGIFSETDYVNAQLPGKAVGIYTHKPVLADMEQDKECIPLIPFAVINRVVGTDMLTYVHKPNECDNNSWSIGIGSKVATLPCMPFGMLDLMAFAEIKAINIQLGLELDQDTIHRFLSYSSFVLHTSILRAPLLGLAHRITLPRETVLPSTHQKGQWVDNETLHQMNADGLLDIWSEMLLAEEFV